MSHEFPPSEDPALRGAPPPPEAAGFWRRAGAWLVDALILSFGIILVLPGTLILAAFVYKTVFHARGGRTPGKRLAGIRVVAVDGGPLGWGRSVKRSLAAILSALPLGLGYLPAAFGEKQALHDMLADTKVVRTEKHGHGREFLFGALAGTGLVAILTCAVLSVFAAAVGARPGRFRELVFKSGEAATKDNLGTLRAAAALYYNDTDGSYPPSLDALVGRRRVTRLGETNVGVHPKAESWTAYGDEVCGKTDDPLLGKLSGARLRDTGAWGYVTDPASNCRGMVFVDCTHRDSKGKPWFEY